MEIGETLYVTKRSEWRRWLSKHHATAKEIWLVFPNKASGRPRLPYNDAVEEALCFGWIDSIVKKPDAESAAQRFSPRRPKAPYSEMNKERIRRLFAAGKMAPAGLATAAAVLDEDFVVPKDIERALRKDAATWRNFQAFPASYQRIRVGWIDAARTNPEAFETRLRYFIKMTAQNKRFGMVQ